jgi:hypothetical protein
MMSRVAFAAMLATLLGIILVTPAPAVAGCNTNADCQTPGDTCQVTLDLWVYKFKDCKFTLCNVDTNCTGGTICRNGRCLAACQGNTDCIQVGGTCSNGLCRTASSSPGSGGGIPGEGRKCMPPDGSKPADWAKDAHGKPLGACPQGTSCSAQGYCRKLQQ